MIIYIAPKELMVRDDTYGRTNNYDESRYEDERLELVMDIEDAFYDNLDIQAQNKQARQKQGFAARCQRTPPVLTVARSAL